jgi:DNA end-binding protein Ku
MAYRSVWKGFLKLALITCPVKLYGATSESDGQEFTLINRPTGNKIEMDRVDSVTRALVAKDDIGKGIEVATGKYAEITAEEIESVAPSSAHTIEIEELVPRTGVSWLFPDALYYLAPDGLAAGEAFALIRDGIRKSRLAALGQIAMGTRERLVMIEPGEKVLRLSTLRYAPEVRSEDAVFPKLIDIAAPAEYSDAVATILARRRCDGFDPAHFTDGYTAALGELVADKIAGKMVKRTAAPPPQLIDLEKAVKRSEKFGGKRGRAA